MQNKLIPDATEWLGKRNEEVKHIYSITKKKGHKSKYLTDTKMQQIWLHDILRTIA